MKCFCHADFQVIAQIGATPVLLPSTAAEAARSEYRFENVAQIGKTACALPIAIEAAILECFMAKTVISSAFLRVLQAVIGLISSEEQTSELQSLMSITYAVFCLKK